MEIVLVTLVTFLFYAPIALLVILDVVTFRSRQFDADVDFGALDGWA